MTIKKSHRAIVKLVNENRIMAVTTSTVPESVIWITHQPFDHRVYAGVTGEVIYEGTPSRMLWNFYPDAKVN